MPTIETRIAENYREVVQRIDAACRRSGRPTSDVTLVAVTKYARIEWVQALAELGVRDLGESRPQQLIERIPLVTRPVRWHLVGHLQRNKARRVLPLVELIHSVDTLRLLNHVDRLAEELGLRPRLLLEVNVSGEAAKDGFAPDELRREWHAVLGCRHVRIDGLMTMAPLADDAEEARPVFRRLRELRDELAARSPDLPLRELSMGMSGDFEVAIEEGATFVRTGSRLFAGLG
jgi:PLP dependent protein